MAEVFEAALESFRAFAEENGYPCDLVWMRPEQLIARPGSLYVRPLPENAGLELAREAFQTAVTQNRGVVFHALFCSGAVTFCHAWLPRDDDQSARYLMPKKGLKMSVAAGEHRPAVHIVHSRMHWLVLRFRYRKYDALRDSLFNIED